MRRYELMLSCWNEDPFARPSFKRARQHLDQVISSTEEAEEYLHLISAELIDDSYNIKFWHAHKYHYYQLGSGHV